MPFPVSYHGAVPAPRAAERPHLLGGLGAALRREGARHIRIGGERVAFRVVRFPGGMSVLAMADCGQVRIRLGPEGPVLDYEVSVRRWAMVVTAASFLWLGGGALLLGVPFVPALTFAALVSIVMLACSYVTTRSRFASFLRRLAADPRPPAT